MNDELIKRYSLMEITLLALFMMGLVVAQIIVKARQRVILSEPISLTGSGLSVAMPTNPGWEYEKTWRYEAGDSMVLVAQHQLRQSREAAIQWRYYLCSPAGTAQDILEQRVRETDSKLGPIETISQPIPMVYALVYPAGGSNPPFYMGVARLDFGRHLELQIFPTAADAFYADNLFRALAGGIHYALPEQLQRGKDVTRNFWGTLKTDALSLGKHADKAFLIKSTDNRPVGYSYQRYSTLHTDQQTQLQIVVRQYEHNLSLIESTFWFNGSEKRFTWKTSLQHVGMGSPRTYAVASEPDGMITVRGDFEKEKQFVSDSLLPELLLPEYAAMLLDGEQSGLIVDILSPTGAVIPAHMAKIDVTQTQAHSEQIAYAVKIDFLNNPKLFEEFYFDAQRQLIGQLEQQPLQQRLWDLTTLKDLQRIFQDNFQPSKDKVAVNNEKKPE